MARLNTNGTLDVSFDACIAAGSGVGVTALELRSDGKILMSGTFTFSVGTSRDGLALLERNGNVDVTYAPQPGVNAGRAVYALAQRSNGTIFLGGSFRSYHDVARAGLVRLNNNATPDVGFDPGTGINDGSSLYTIAVQADGKLIVGGEFAFYNGQAKSGVARTNPDGSLDSVFDPGTGPNNAVGSIAIQSDGRILVAGRFSSFNGAPRNGLVRLKGDPAPFRFSPPSALDGGPFQLMFLGEDQARYAIDSSSNLLDWLPLINLSVTNATMPIVDAEIHSRRFYRARLLP